MFRSSFILNTITSKSTKQELFSLISFPFVNFINLNIERLACDKTQSASQEMDIDPETWVLRKA